MIVRVQKDKNFTTIHNHAANDERLSLKAKGLFYYLMTKPDTWNISREGIRTQIREGQSAIGAALTELEEYGYLDRRRLNTDGHFKWEATLFEIPLPENRTMGNRTQVNTNKVNTDLLKTDLAQAVPNGTGVPPEEELSTGQNQLERRLGVIDGDGSSQQRSVGREPVETPPVLPAQTSNSNGTLTGEVVRREVPPAAPRAYGDPAINNILDAFEKTFDLKLKRVKQQRIAASNLIRAYGELHVLGGVRAAAQVRDEQYAPQILNLEDLWNKWDKLTAFYRKKQIEQKPKTTIIGDE